MTEATLTTKNQATVPKDIRKALGIGPGSTIDWQVIRTIVTVEPRKKFKNPVEFLTSHVHLDLDMVKVVREIREGR
jgi:AbrB family looped-hinge helix DNA binding protein